MSQFVVCGVGVYGRHVDEAIETPQRLRRVVDQLRAVVRTRQIGLTDDGAPTHRLDRDRL